MIPIARGSLSCLGAASAQCLSEPKAATAWRVDATLVTPTSAKLTNDAKQQLMPAQGAHMKHGMAHDKNDLHP